MRRGFESRQVHKIIIIMTNNDLIKITTVKELKDAIKNVPNDTPVGVFHWGWWNPIFKAKPIRIGVSRDGVALEIDYKADY